MKTTWELIGNAADLRIAEFKANRNEETTLTYSTAKAMGLERLRDHVAPYLARIDELESDKFQVIGALPPLKAWYSVYRDRLIVTSKSKKRAMDLVGESRYSSAISHRVQKHGFLRLEALSCQIIRSVTHLRPIEILEAVGQS